jgi:hypothetical protein
MSPCCMKGISSLFRKRPVGAIVLAFCLFDFLANQVASEGFYLQYDMMNPSHYIEIITIVVATFLLIYTFLYILKPQS